MNSTQTINQLTIAITVAEILLVLFGVIILVAILWGMRGDDD